MLGSAKHVDQVDRKRNVGEARVGFLAQYPVDQRPHRDDAVAVTLHRLCHPVARACGLRRQTDDRDGPDVVEQCAQVGVVGVGEAHKGNSMTWSSITKPCPMSNTRDSVIPNPYLRYAATACVLPRFTCSHRRRPCCWRAHSWTACSSAAPMPWRWWPGSTYSLSSLQRTPSRTAWANPTVAWPRRAIHQA